MLYQRAQLKKAARAAIKTARPRPWLVVLAYLAISAVASGIIYTVMPGSLRDAYLLASMSAPNSVVIRAISATTGMGVMLFVFLSILVALVTIVLEYGLAYYFLRVFRKEDAGVPTLFAGFSRAGTVIGSALLVGLFAWLWTMLFFIAPAIVGAILGLMRVDTVVLSVALSILVFAVMVGIIAIVLRYAMVPYVVMNEELGALASIRRSKELMRGNKWKYFVLGLSFIGWALLVSAIMGVFMTVGALLQSVVLTVILTIVGVLAALPLLLWLETYIYAAFAGFYCTIAGDAPSAPSAPVADEPWNI